jgi:hypothetical protein
MSASKDQSTLNSSSGRRFDSTSNSDAPSTAAQSAGSATAAGHGDHPKDNADDSNATLSGSKYGPQNEDLDGEQMSMLPEGKVMDAQLNKKNAGWGEQESLTSDLDRKKAEQQSAREEVKAERRGGGNVDGGAGGRTDNEGLSSV